MEENVLLDPFDVGFFGAVGVVFDTNGVTDLFEQFLFLRFLGGLHIDLWFWEVYNLLIQF
jgi:hypothetical protein